MFDKNDDPILGPDEKCVYWYGDVTKDDLQAAAIRMVKPGEQAESAAASALRSFCSVTYVNRVLAFIFATDDSFAARIGLVQSPEASKLGMRVEDEKLMQLPKEPFKMSSGDQNLGVWAAEMQSAERARPRESATVDMGGYELRACDYCDPQLYSVFLILFNSVPVFGTPAGQLDVLKSLASALLAGPRDRTADRRKEFELLRHLASSAFPWAASDVLREMEIFGGRRTFLKLAGGLKRQLLEETASKAPAGLVVELGTYIGYSSAVLAEAFDSRLAFHDSLLLDTEALARHADALPPSPDQAQGPGAQDQWLKVRAIRAVAQRMPVRIVKKDDLRKVYPPNGIPTAKNQTPDDFLFQACQYSVSTATLERALQKNANVNARNKEGNTPLMLACQNWTGSQYLAFINKLLEQKADVNVESGWGFTPLDKVTELLKEQEAARKQEMRNQEERREIMEGRSIVGYGFGTAEEQRQREVPNQPLADELDTFKCLPQLRECKKLLEQKGAKCGEAPFNPAYLTTEAGGGIHRGFHGFFVVVGSTEIAPLPVSHSTSKEV
ncbi:unnamed protein product [Effrenium voratum]|nr:unnamed protein product [Effrenium voratum]